MTALTFLATLLQDNPADSTLKDLTTTYAAVVGVVIDGQFHARSRSFQSQAAYLTALAGIVSKTLKSASPQTLQASLLASVQIGFVAIIGNPDCVATPTPSGCDAHSRFLRNLIFFLSYLALAFDIWGALFSLLIARRRLEVANQAQELLGQKSSLEERILDQSGVANGQARTNAFKACTEPAQVLLTQLERHRHIIENHIGSQFAAISFIGLGMLCFFAALTFQVITTQPRRLWITFILLVTPMAGLLAWNEIRTHPRLLTYMSSRA